MLKKYVKIAQGKVLKEEQKGNYLHFSTLKIVPVYFQCSDHGKS